jgi:hypothetical protein
VGVPDKVVLVGLDRLYPGEDNEAIDMIAMSIPQALGHLSASRYDLAAAESILIPLAVKNPRLYRRIAPRISRLKNRQEALERRVISDQNPQFGWLLPVAVVGGMVLTAIGGLIMKHRAETGAERMRLETYNECVRKLTEDQKIPYESAVARCQAAIEGVMDTGTDIMGAIKWVGILGLGGASLWLLSKIVK